MLHGAFVSRWDLCLPECFCGWRSRRGRRWLLSLLLVVPGVWLRGYAAGYVKKNAETDADGTLCLYTQPALPGLDDDCFRICGASGSWVIFVALAAGFLAIYLPTIRSEEAYLREHFAGFDEYMRRVPTTAAEADCGAERCSAGTVFAGTVSASPRVQCSYGCGGDLCSAGCTIVAATLVDGGAGKRLAT